MPASTSTFKPTIEISIAKVTIRTVNYLRISQRFEGHHSFEISVSPSMLVGQSNRLKDLAESLVGEPTVISLSQARAGLTSQNMTFIGVLSSIRLIKGQSQTNTYLLSGISMTTFLETGKNTQSFTEQTLSGIVKSLTGNCKCSPTYTQPIPYITQYEEDIFHFLQRLAETYGEWFYYNGKDLIFGKNARPASPTVALINDSNLFDLEYNLRVLPLKFKAHYFNYEIEGFGIFNSKSDEERVSGLSSYAQLALDKSNKLYTDELNELSFIDNYTSENDLKNAVKLKKSELSTKLTVLSGRTPEMELKIGGLISVREPIYTDGRVSETVDYGTFVVTRLNHSIDARNVYQAFFEAVPQDTDFPPVDYNIIPRHAKLHPAMVKDVADPLKLGRVKVQFWWQSNIYAPKEEFTPWIRVSSMMTSHSKSYFIPEKDDTVMVDFEFGNPDLPFVVGGFYANESSYHRKPEELFTPDNHLKGIITRGKNHIIIDDTEGKEKISIYNKDKKNKIELSLDGTHITIKSDGDININAGGDIKMKAKNIMMEAEKDWKVKADHAVIETQSGDIELIAGKDLNVSAMNNIVIAAVSELRMSGMTAKLEADATMVIKATATLDIDGGAMATLKGAMVMIN